MPIPRRKKKTQVRHFFFLFFFSLLGNIGRRVRASPTPPPPVWVLMGTDGVPENETVTFRVFTPNVLAATRIDYVGTNFFRSFRKSYLLKICSVIIKKIIIIIIRREREVVVLPPTLNGFRIFLLSPSTDTRPIRLGLRSSRRQNLTSRLSHFPGPNIEETSRTGVKMPNGPPPPAPINPVTFP